MQLEILFEFQKNIQLVEVQIPKAAFTLSLREWEKTMPSPLTESMRAGHMLPMLLPPSGCSGYCKCPSTNQHSREVGIWQRRFDLTQPCLWRQAPLWPDNYLKHLHRWWQSIRWGLITQYTAAEWHTTPDTLCDVTIIKQSRPRSLKTLIHNVQTHLLCIFPLFSVLFFQEIADDLKKILWREEIVVSKTLLSQEQAGNIIMWYSCDLISVNI